MVQKHLVGALLAFLMGSLAIAADPAIKVDPTGEPDELRKGNAIRYFLWYDGTEWHLRTDTAGKKHTFTGTIEVVGGKVTSITDFENLESGKKKKKSDVGKLNQNQTQVAFEFVTSKK